VNTLQDDNSSKPQPNDSKPEKEKVEDEHLIEANDLEDSDSAQTYSEEQSSVIEVRPIISIVGRPNVGKSTLYNRLTRSRDAIVDDRPGVTRDRMVGVGRVGDKPYWIVDTGGIEADDEEIHGLMKGQVDQALMDSDAVIFIVDGREGPASVDFDIAKQLRANPAINVYLAANKSEGLDKAMVAADFYQFGLDEPYLISGKNGDGIHKLLRKVLKDTEGKDTRYDIPEGVPKFAIVGRPNVGKSTLVNALVGEERVVVFDMPGTTRDAIHVPFEYDDREYVLIDTAGVRKKSRIVNQYGI